MSSQAVSLQDLQQASRPVLFYDGDCGFCSQTVQFVLDHERCDVLQFASLQSPLADALRERYNSELKGVDSLIVLTPDRLLIKSDAACFLAKHLRFPWSLISWLTILPSFLRNSVYDRIAEQRLKISQRFGFSCRRSEASKDRFLD